MNKIREILRLKDSGLSQRKTAVAVGKSRSVIQDYWQFFNDAELTHEHIKNISDEKLIEELNSARKKASPERLNILRSCFSYFTLELKRVGVTLFLLWEEYIQSHPDGYSYARFCHHYKIYREEQKISMHMEHKSGDKMFVDFTGKKLSFINELGEVQEVEVFVAVLGGSSFTYVEAIRSQKKEDWLNVNANALKFFGGVPNAIVPDNLKSAVTNASCYEADINPEFEMFAHHYGTFILPTRSAKPKDKSLVEGAVKIIYTRIFALLRNEKFFSLADLNTRIWHHLEEHNNKPMQQLKKSRREIFDQEEKHLLKPLPATDYIYKKISIATVQANYHVYVKDHNCYYSVDYKLRGKKVHIYTTLTSIEVFFSNQRVALHLRNPAKKYITNLDHMSPQHRFMAELTPENILSKAKKVGDEVYKYCEVLLSRNQHPEQNHKSCMGVINLQNKYGTSRLLVACKRASSYNNFTYQFVRKILINRMDLIDDGDTFASTLITHENLRGGDYYKESQEKI